jgi:hypothetical protein
MNLEEHQRAVAMIKKDPRSSGITITRESIGLNDFALAAQIKQTGERFTIRTREEFSRWWSPQLQSAMTMQRVKAHLEDREHSLK